MGRVAKLLSFVRVDRNGAKISDVKGDPGGGANVTAEHYAAPGDDSVPLAGDYFATVDGPGTGREQAVGYLDPTNSPKAQPGDKRIYARDPGTGGVVAELWLKNTGDVVCSNASGSFELQPGGTIVLNGVTIDPSGNIAATSVSAPSVQANGKELAGHTHPVTTAPGTTGPNN